MLKLSDILLSPRQCLFKGTSTKIMPKNMPGNVFLGLELKTCSTCMSSSHFHRDGY